MNTETSAEYSAPSYYAVEMFRNGEWVTDLRTYYFDKNLTDFDMVDVEGKRRNARKLSSEEYELLKKNR